MNLIKKILNVTNTSSILSVLIHLVILVLLIGAFSFEPQREKYIEVGFGVPGGGSGGASPEKGNEILPSNIIPVTSSSKKGSPKEIKIKEEVPKKSSEDVISKKYREEKKVEGVKNPGASTATNAIGVEGTQTENNKSNVTGKGGAGTNPEGTGIGNGTGSGSGNGNGNGDGEGDGVGDGYSIDFGGRIRKIYSYVIPDYPDGVYKQADVRLRFNVMPDGAVGKITILTKVDGRLELAAINSLRLWRFEPLSQNQRQAEQTVVITFPFRLR